LAKCLHLVEARCAASGICGVVMAEVRGRYVYNPALTPGRSEDGGWSHLLFDGDGRLADHAVFIPDDGSEDGNDEARVELDAGSPSPEESAQTIGAAIGVAVIVVAGAVLAAPHVKRWWLDALMPRLRRLGRRGRQRAVVEPLALTAAPADFSRAVEVAVDQSGERMSRAEAEKRLAAVLAAAAFVADQVRTLRNARIDDGDVAELGHAMGMPSTQHVTDAINRMLEADASLLDEKASKGFMRVFGGGREVDGQYIPIQNERIREALRLTRGEPDAYGDD
jgi:hypothetical protein